MSLAGMKVLIAGGAGAIGRALVDAVQAKGAQVAIIDLPGEALESMRQGRPWLNAVAGDLTDPESVQRAVADVYRALGDVGALINCTGMIHSAPLISLARAPRMHSVEDWRRVMGANLDAVFYLGREVADRMVASRMKGVIVNFSSISAAGNAGQSAYSAAKAGVEALTAVWAKELGSMGIRVLAIAPGFIDTESTRKALTEHQLEELRREIPLRRLGTVEEVAQLVIAAIENRYLSGKTLSLDGGLAM